MKSSTLWGGIVTVAVVGAGGTAFYLGGFFDPPKAAVPVHLEALDPTSLPSASPSPAPSATPTKAAAKHT